MARKFWLLSAALLLLFPLSIFAQSTAFQYDIRGVGGLYSHTPATPLADWTFIGGPVPDPEQEYDVIAMDADSTGTLYGVDLNLPLTLGTIDPVDASFTTVAVLSGDVPPDCNAMTIDPTTDLAWISDGNGLWTMDISTGVCTLVASQFTNTAGGAAITTVFELATDGAGNFWAFDITLDTLWNLDETNGNVTALGVYPGPGNPNFSNNGMDWDPVSGQLIGDVYTGGGTGSYGIWNTTTGAFTLILAHSAYPLSDPRVGGPIACFGGTTYQVNFYLDTFVTFATLNPGAGVTSIPQPVAPVPFAMDFDASGTTLYAVDSANVALGTIDLTTGQYSEMMPITGDWATAGGTAVGITCDASTDQFYLTNTTSLFTLDVTTGDTVFVADYAGPPLSDDPTTVIEIACNEAGDMYIFSSGDNKLWSVDKTTGVSTELGTGPLPPAGSFIQGMDFDPATGELYASIYVSGGTGYYGTWDTSTGVFTTIVPLQGLPSPGDGYELKLAIQLVTGPVVVAGESLTVSPGIISSGGLGDLTDSDNVSLVIFRNPATTTAVTQFVLTSTSPTATPTSFEFKLEGRCVSRPNVVQRIEFFNYVTAAFEIVDERNAVRMPPDLVVNVTPTGDLSRFVDPTTREIQTRVRYRADSPRASFSSRTDQAVWTIQ
jgi:hypothetical protein